MIVCLMVWSLLYQRPIILWTDTTTMETLSLRYEGISECPVFPTFLWFKLQFVFPASSAAPSDSQSSAGPEGPEQPAEAAGGKESPSRSISPSFTWTCWNLVLLLRCSWGWWETGCLWMEELLRSGAWDTASLKMCVKHAELHDPDLSREPNPNIPAVFQVFSPGHRRIASDLTDASRKHSPDSPQVQTHLFQGCIMSDPPYVLHRLVPWSADQFPNFWTNLLVHSLMYLFIDSLLHSLKHINFQTLSCVYWLYHYVIKLFMYASTHPIISTFQFSSRFRLKRNLSNHSTGIPQRSSVGSDWLVDVLRHCC